MIENFDSLFTDLIAQTQRAIDSTPTVDPEDAPEVVGGAFDDRILVTMKAGRVTNIEIQPPAMRLEFDELCQHLVEATNAAIDANLAAMTSGADAGTDLQSLSQQLQQIQGESLRQMDRYTQGMTEMLRQAKEMGPK